MNSLFIALRPKQWIKNAFIFCPLIFGKKLFIFPENIISLIGFCLFCLSSGSVYLVNDIVDIDKDRFHPIKKLRPLASGNITVREAVVCAFLLAFLSLICSFLLDIYFGWIVGAYLLFNFFYSKILKNIVIIDVFCLALFFLLRIAAGGILANVEISRWILIMTTLLSLFLGFNKRLKELQFSEERKPSVSRMAFGYNRRLIDLLILVITSLIILAYILYVTDVRTVSEFGSFNLLYSVPFVYYGIFRYLYLIHKIREYGDPTHILLSDRPLRITILLWVGICIAVIYF
ncbi:MAG: decaprenyl-phosphate phosphoribosyltransferase [Candidatus Omnitrophica bacterium]|nr:decaprenyl-phosphate phosphoribosyltransferase [Candidatus Omnitrophota bacterium]